MEELKAKQPPSGYNDKPPQSSIWTALLVNVLPMLLILGLFVWLMMQDVYKRQEWDIGSRQ